MIEHNETTEFLEEAIQDLLEHPENPTKIVLCYIESDGVSISYNNCTYSDLQRIGIELVNEGAFRLIALNEERIKQIREEAEAEDNSDEA